MKHIIWTKLCAVAAIFFMLSTTAWAQSTFTLISDPLDTRAEWVEIEVDSIVDPACDSLNPCIAAGAVSYDVTKFVVAEDAIVVRARACRTTVNGGTCSVWTASVPFDFAAPNGVTGLIIVES